MTDVGPPPPGGSAPDVPIPHSPGRLQDDVGTVKAVRRVMSGVGTRHRDGGKPRAGPPPHPDPPVARPPRQGSRAAGAAGSVLRLRLGRPRPPPPRLGLSPGRWRSRDRDLGHRLRHRSRHRVRPRTAPPPRRTGLVALRVGSRLGGLHRLSRCGGPLGHGRVQLGQRCPAARTPPLPGLDADGAPPWWRAQARRPCGLDCRSRRGPRSLRRASPARVRSARGRTPLVPCRDAEHLVEVLARWSTSPPGRRTAGRAPC